MPNTLSSVNTPGASVNYTGAPNTGPANYTDPIGPSNFYDLSHLGTSALSPLPSTLGPTSLYDLSHLGTTPLSTLPGPAPITRGTTPVSSALPSWLPAPDTAIRELIGEYNTGSARSNSSIAALQRAGDEQQGNILTTAMNSANNAASEYANRTRQAGGNAAGAGLVRAQGQVSGQAAAGEAKVQQARDILAARERAATLASQIAGNIGDLRTKYLNTLTGFQSERERQGLDRDKLGFEQERLGVQQNTDLARLGLDRDRLGYERESDRARLGVEQDRLGVQRAGELARLGLDRDRLGYERESDRARLGVEQDRLGVQRDTERGRLGLDRARLSFDENANRGRLGIEEGNLNLNRDRLAMDQRALDMQDAAQTAKNRWGSYITDRNGRVTENHGNLLQGNPNWNASTGFLSGSGW